MTVGIDFVPRLRRCSIVVAVAFASASAVEAALPMAQPTTAVSGASGSESLRAFDPQDFELAYQVLLGAGDLKRAFLVAQRAVQSVPGNRQWRRKLAQVSEWTQRPDVAAQQWLALFDQGDRSVDTVQAVIRLAPQSDQPLLALQAWAELAMRQPLTDAQWMDVFSLYELAAEPLKGAHFFESQFATSNNPKLLELAARLAENGGDDDRAQRLYSQRAGMAPFSLDVMLRAVVQLVRKDKMQDALALLQAHQHQVPAQAVAYWQLLSQVAWDAGNYGVARSAYAQYAGGPQTSIGDWSRLIFLVRPDYPAQAADLALMAYRKFGSTDQLMLALGIYEELGDAASQSRVYAELGEKATTLAMSEPRFLMMRGQFYQRQKMTKLAWTDFQQALKQAPSDADALQANLWFLVDEQRVDVLPRFLRAHAPAAAKDVRLWSAYAAASQVLERHRDAVGWYAKAAAHRPNDFPMLLNYADALERVGRSGMADRVRRHVWTQLKEKFPNAHVAKIAVSNPELLALARLSLVNQPGDPSLALVRQWVSQMRGLADAPSTEQTAILVLGWAILTEQFSTARAWMWKRYARHSQTAPPIWADSQTALQLQETQIMDYLLSRRGDAMPIYNRYDTAYALGHVRQATDMAFLGMAPQDDEPLYDRYRQHVPAQSNYAQLAWSLQRQGGLNSHALQFETRFMVNPTLELLLSGTRSQQSGSDSGPVLQALTPSTDRLMGAQLNWRGSRGTTSLAVTRRDELDSLTSVRLQQNYQWGGRLSLEAGVDVQAESNISLPMQVAGYENSLHASMTYALGKREYLRIAPRASRYYSQFGDDMGSGNFLDMEFGYRIRTEYPDWRVRGYLTRQLFSVGNGMSAESFTRLPLVAQTAVLDAFANGSIDPVHYFVPESRTNWGGCWGMGENLAGQNLQTTYTRAWRPFFDLCANHNTVSGTGASGSVGLAGSITGEDHVYIELRSSDGTQTGNLSTNALVVRYRRYF
jgi:tetratricopeptide (TPR) repeat protein